LLVAKDRIAALISALQLLYSIMLTYLTGDFLYLVVTIAFTTLVFIVRKEYRDAVSLAWSVSVFTPQTPASIIPLLSLLIVHAELPVSEEFPERPRLWRSALTATVLTPVYLLNPYSTIPAAFYLLVNLVLSFKEYLRLSRVRVEVGEKARSIMMGEQAVFNFYITSKGVIAYRVIVNNEVQGEGFADGNHSFQLGLHPNTAGVHEYRVVFEIADPRGLSKIALDPFTLKIKVTPRSLVIMRAFREILAKYYSTITPPPIWVITPSWEYVTGSSIGTGNLGEGVGAGGVASGKALPGGEGKEGYKADYTLVFFANMLRKYDQGLRVSVPGEYDGAREYMPGDHPRSIHWKKSISKGQLVVKSYSRTSEDGGGGSDFVIADWDASNPVELDRLINTTYAALFATKRRIRLLLKLPNGDMFYTEGTLVQIIAALNELLAREEVKARFNYESFFKPQVMIEETVTYPVWDELVNYYMGIARGVLKLLEEKNIGGNAGFILIYPMAYSLKYQVIGEYLRKVGLTGIKIKESANLKQMIRGLEGVGK